MTSADPMPSLSLWRAGTFASGSTRRLMWTLAHAHGALLAILNLAFAGGVHLVNHWTPTRRRFASAGLRAGALLLPAGFFLGGLFAYEGDPGLGILLVPIGALLLITAVLLVALSTRS